MLNIHTFGGLSIQRDDVPINSFISRKVEALLVYLSCEPYEHPRETLAELLWSDFSQERAMANLRAALSNLQDQLGDYLIVTRQNVMINPDASLWLDTRELEMLLTDADGHLTVPLVQRLEKGLLLYRGAFLSGFQLRNAAGFEAWQQRRSKVAFSKVIDVLKRLILYAWDQQNYLDGIRYSHQLLSFDPLSEETHRELMRLLAASGQYDTALTQYETCVRLLRENLNSAPEAETTRLFAEIQASTVLVQPLQTKSVIKLPLPATPFIERPAELKQIADWLDKPECRLLTIAGPGGIGKTRLAIRTASEHAHAFPDGVFFVPLASVQSPDFVSLEIASVLQFTMKKTESPDRQLIDYLASRKLLLVLDNFEHLIGSAMLIAEILAHAEKIKIVVTSREWLNLQEEWIAKIGGMSFPSKDRTDSSDAIAHYDAIKFFISCAQRTRPRFSFLDESDAVIRICQLVEGMPLAIELAATWLRYQSAAQIVQHLDISLQSALSNEEAVSERHRTLREVFAYSWNLLSVTESEALMKLSVFRGPFDRVAADVVGDASLPVLASLIDKSLVRLADKGMYDIHELLRQYAFDHLVESGTDRLLRNVHLDFFVQLASDAEAQLHGQQQAMWLDRLSRERDNLNSALSWALDENSQTARETGLTLGASLWGFWLMRGYITEGRHWLERLLNATQGIISLARGTVTQGAGYLAYSQGDYDRAESWHQEGLAIRRQLNDKAGMGGSLSNLGIVAWVRGDSAAAQAYYEQALAVRREGNYRLGMASVLTNLVIVLQDQGNYTSAIPHAQEALALFTELEDMHGQANVLMNLGVVCFNQGDWEQALVFQEQALKLARKLGDPRITAAVLQNLGGLACLMGNLSAAHLYLNESLSLVIQIGDKSRLATAKESLARLALAEGRLEHAQILIDESLALLYDLGKTVYFGLRILTQGDLYRERLQYAEAKTRYNSALEIFLGSKNWQPSPSIRALLCLAKIAVAEHDLTYAVTLLSLADDIAINHTIRIREELDQPDRHALSLELNTEEYDRAWRLGKVMTLREILNYNLIQG